MDILTWFSKLSSPLWGSSGLTDSLFSFCSSVHLSSKSFFGSSITQTGKSSSWAFLFILFLFLHSTIKKIKLKKNSSPAAPNTIMVTTSGQGARNGSVSLSTKQVTPSPNRPHAVTIHEAVMQMHFTTVELIVVCCLRGCALLFAFEYFISARNKWDGSSFWLWMWKSYAVLFEKGRDFLNLVFPFLGNCLIYGFFSRYCVTKIRGKWKKLVVSLDHRW